MSYWEDFDLLDHDPESYYAQANLWREWAAKQQAFIGPPVYNPGCLVHKCEYCGRERNKSLSCPGCGAP